MLKSLSGDEQKVHTAVVVKNLSSNKKKQMVESTKLRMKEFTPQEIEHFKDKNLDKAGGYAIQGMDDGYIEWCKGSYTNVVGFPVEMARRFLRSIW